MFNVMELVRQVHKFYVGFDSKTDFDQSKGNYQYLLYIDESGAVSLKLKNLQEPDLHHYATERRPIEMSMNYASLLFYK
jgi:hypothetical protein